jgi:hypothetical protein
MATPEYGANQLRILPLPARVPQADGSYLEHWEMELERPLPPEAAWAGPEILAAASVELGVVLRGQGFPELVPTEEELRRFDVQLIVSGGSAILLRLRLVHGRANLAMGITAQVWLAVERRFSQIRSIQGVEREAWRLFLGPPAE